MAATGSGGGATGSGGGGEASGAGACGTSLIKPEVNIGAGSRTVERRFGGSAEGPAMAGDAVNAGEADSGTGW